MLASQRRPRFSVSLCVDAASRPARRRPAGGSSGRGWPRPAAYWICAHRARRRETLRDSVAGLFAIVERIVEPPHGVAGGAEVEVAAQLRVDVVGAELQRVRAALPA